MNQGSNIVKIALGTIVILLIPLIAMQFNSGVNWTAFDFLVMGILLFLTGVGLDFAMRKAQSSTQKVLYSAIILVLFLYIWAELAVGVFTNLGS